LNRPEFSGGFVLPFEGSRTASWWRSRPILPRPVGCRPGSRRSLHAGGQDRGPYYGPVKFLVKGGTITHLYVVGDPRSEDDERGPTRAFC
jgi:hypothetical protein